MEWISVKDRLPKENRPFLGYCFNESEDGLCSWKGIVEVDFDPSVGWRRCENHDDKPVRVIYWCEMPKLPKDK